MAAPPGVRIVGREINATVEAVIVAPLRQLEVELFETRGEGLFRLLEVTDVFAHKKLSRRLNDGRRAFTNFPNSGTILPDLSKRMV